jgi:hypothetical protein
VSIPKWKSWPCNGGRPQAGFRSVDAKNAKLRRKNAKKNEEVERREGAARLF